MEKHNNNQIEDAKKISEEQSESVSGGRKGLFPKIKLWKTWCDFCGERIDSKTRFGVPVLNDEKIMCNECYKKQSDLLGQDNAAQKWLGINNTKKIHPPEKSNNI